MESNLGFFKRTAIRMGIIRNPLEIRSETVVAPPYGSSESQVTSYTPLAVGVSEALTIPTLYRCADIISGDVSQLSIGVWRYINSVRTEVPPTPLLRQPDPNISMSDFLELTTLSMVLYANAYWRVYRKDDSDPVSQVMRLEVLSADAVSIEVDWLGRKTGYQFDGKKLKLHQIEHINRFPVAGTPYGQGPIQKAQRFLRGVLDMQTYADNWFKKGAIPSGYLKSDQILTAEMADKNRKRWMEQFEQRGYGPAFLDGGTSWVQNYLNPKDAMFIENQDHNDRVIATLFGVPAYKVHAAVEGTNLTYQNLQDANRDYINDTLMKYLNKIEAALTRLTPRGQEIKFKTEDLLRSDYKTQVETIKTAVEADLMDKNDGRAQLGQPPTKEAQPGTTPGGTTEPNGV